MESFKIKKFSLNSKETCFQTKLLIMQKSFDFDNDFYTVIFYSISGSTIIIFSTCSFLKNLKGHFPPTTLLKTTIILNTRNLFVFALHLQTQEDIVT